MATKLLLPIWVISLLTGVGLTPTLAQQSPTATALQQLVDAARKEGQLDLMAPSDLDEAGARAIVSAFNRRFGLDLKIDADVSGQESQQFNKAVAETKSGIPPTFDAIQGSEGNVSSLKSAGGAELIDNWEAILAEISTQASRVKDKVSPSILSGYGFVYATRIGVLLYNPKQIAARDLPKTRKEMGDPKYARAFPLPPWTVDTLEGILRYNKEELLEIAKAWGRLKPAVLNYKAGIQRMMLGEFKFLPGRSHDYFTQKAIDPTAPLGLSFFEDITTMSSIAYVVRKGARHPNAAKLFTLWTASPEAHLVLEKYSYNQNLILPSSPLSQEMLKALKERNIKPVGWFDNAETLEKFRWLTTTTEGDKYAKAIAQALRKGE